jgi:ADP-heptose:LPS heptosyltransferase
MKNIAIYGLASPTSIGDALQYWVLLDLLKKHVAHSKIALICPELSDNIFVFGMEQILCDQIFDMKIAYPFVLNRTHSFTKRQNPRMNYITAEEMLSKNPHGKVIKRILEVISRYIDTYGIDKIISTHYVKHSLFDAGLIGGHTATPEIRGYLLKYNLARSITRGPLVMAPLSISTFTFDKLGHDNSAIQELLLHKRLKNILDKVEFVYARGPLTYKILRESIGIKDEKIKMAIDSGFGIKLLYDPKPNVITRRNRPKIVIVPRKEYYIFYNKHDLYRRYVRSFSRFIQYLMKEEDSEIYLTSQTIYRNPAINDLVHFFQKSKISDHMNHLRVFEPRTIIDLASLISKADLVITSYMHSGVMSLSYGVPTLFVLPYADTKVVDILMFLHLETNKYLVDMFNTKSLDNDILEKGKTIFENKKNHYEKIITAIGNALPSLVHPVESLINLLE